MTDSGEYKNKICRENIHIFKLELAEHNTRFIKTLKENQLTSDEVNNFHPLFSQNNLWQYGSIINVRNIHLEELFEAIFSYCQCESPLNPELVDQLINCFSTILTTLKEWSKMDSSEGNESGQDYIKDLFQNSILGIFKNILFNFGNSNSKKCLELSQIKMKNHILINLSKLLNGLICTANNMSLSLSSEVNDVLILMLLKMNELIIQEKHKMICITFYINVIEYFHQTFQDKVAIEFLHKILLHNKQLTSETKFSIIIFLFDHIDSYYLMKSKVGMNSFDQSKSTLAPIVTNNHKQEAENFLKHLKELSLAELTNVNQSVRKSALYVMKRIYQLECEDIPDMNYTWENFFHIFETLEETQVKLIVPVLENITSCDCLVLKKILLIRMFQYDNGTIVKAGIKSLHLLNNDPDIIVSLLSTLMKALNNSSLFVPEIEVVKTSLVTLFQLFNTPYTKEGLYQDFINSIITVAWGPVPLFFIIHYLELSSSDLKPLYLYDNNVLPILNSNFETVTKLLKLNFKHNPIIRSAIDSCLRKHISTCLVLPLRQMNIIVDNMELVSVLDHFLNACTPADDKDVTNIYGKLFKDLASSLVIDEEFMHQYMAERFIADSKVQESCFNMIALYFCNTSGSKKQEDFLFLVERKLKNDKSAESYENIFKIIKFGFKYTFLSPLIWCGVNLLNIEVKCCFLHSFLSMYYSEEQFSDNFKNLLEHRDLEIYGKYLEFLIENCSVVRVFLEKQLKDDSIDFLNQQFGIFKSEFNYLYTFNRFYNSYSCDEYFLLNEKHLNALFNKNNFFKCANRKSVKLKINMFLRLCQGRHERHEILVDLFIFSELCLEALSNTNRDCLNEILEIMELLMFFCSSEDYKEKRVQSNEIIKEFIKASFQEVKNTRRTTVFRSSMNAWIYSVISVLNDEVYHDVLMECVEEILEHEESSHCLFKRIHNLMCYSIRIRNQSNSCESFLLCLIAKGLVYGDLPKKDIVVERTVCDYIRQHKLGTQWHVKFHHSCHIRYKCTQAILYYIGVLKHEAWGMLLLDHLKQVFDSDQARVQYFHNSLTHRIKQRAIQNILLLDHILRNRRSKQDLFVWGLRNILNYNHQPSIRYFLEWLIIRNLDSAECTNQFWSHFDKAYDERPGSIVSFLCIVFHAVHRIVTSQGPYTQHQTNLTDEAFERIISCSMSQLFNLRLYANVVFIKLYQSLDQHWSHLSHKYQMVFNAMMRTKTSAKGNAIFNAEKLSSDFYFNRFEPFAQFSVETIFIELPRLADVATDEWGYWQTLLEEDRAVSLVEEVVCIRSGGAGLRGVEKPEWVVSSHARQMAEEPESTGNCPDAPSRAVSQKKFIPWKPPCPTQDTPSPSISQLIIVTSLIEKLPNIGGLSRSCEVFGATLVVDSLDILRDVEFKALSMTSEKHLNIIEVKRHNLKQYLRHMRCEEGYQLIGAEQTNNSVKLQDFQYPKKSMLVLGNEREGIISDILVLLDTYVEIPQLGVLRSLNVHVTGALFIWEYVKQHCL